MHVICNNSCWSDLNEVEFFDKKTLIKGTVLNIDSKPKCMNDVNKRNINLTDLWIIDKKLHGTKSSNFNKYFAIKLFQNLFFKFIETDLSNEQENFEQILSNVIYMIFSKYYFII